VQQCGVSCMLSCVLSVVCLYRMLLGIIVHDKSVCDKSYMKKSFCKGVEERLVTSIEVECH
jgi:hypothetical protein